MLEQSRYWLGHGARVGWYLGQYILSSRLSGRLATVRRPAPSLAELLQDLAQLLISDSSNIRAQLYRLPKDVAPSPRRCLGDALRYFIDLPTVNARRRRRGYDEVARTAAASALPAYYRRNFHYQTDGYLSDWSARLYDQQVEVLFLGSADAMRRQSLPAITGYLRQRGADAAVLLDVGCGTGRFLTSVAESYPQLRLIGLDLSSAYLRQATSQLEAAASCHLLRGTAVAMPFADGAIDLVTCIYLLHEVPGEIRAGIARETARILKPGGRLIVVDSLQYGDKPEYDGLLDSFPEAFHEPYYAEYAAADLDAVFTPAGFSRLRSCRAFLSKVIVYQRRAAA